MGASAARRARKSLSVILLPKLHASLIEPTERDSSHKLNRKAGGAVGAEIPSQKPDSAQKDEEETLVMRVPIALAAVKMLQRLPTDFMEENLSGILLKVMAFLKCRLESVRRAARETLVEISVSLGPKYLPVVVREMSSLLLSTRGYAFHVLAFTAHSLLVALVSLMQPGDINKCLRDFLEICKADLFGLSAEEKEVNRITAKVYEAKSHKSYDSFQLLAKVVPESCLIDLIQPLKEVLDSTHSYKSVKIVKECLIRVVKGLSDNSFISSPALVTFLYGVLSQNISSLWPVTAKETEKPLPRRAAGAYAGVNGTVSKPLALPADSYLIPKEPRKVRSKVTGAVDKVGAQANAHTMTEFGLQLLHSLLKKEQIKWRKDVVMKDSFIVTDMNGEKQSDEVVVDIMMLDPLVPVVCRSLESKHAKIATLALNCFRMMLRMDLPSLYDHLVKAAQAVYTILHKYAGATSGDNYNLAVAAFKAVAVLVRFMKSLPVEEDHLSALLTYVSRDLDLGGEVGSSSSYSGPARTATAFGVLRSILARKLRSPLIPPLMKRVAKLSIIAEASHIQAQSRQVFLQFLLDYPMSKKKLDSNVSFYLGQLDYELLSGRESALEFIQSIISVFPPLVLKNFSGIIFVSLAARLIEEEMPSCRKRVAEIIKSMLLRLNKATRDTLFSMLLIWMKDSELTHQQIAFQVCGILVLAEGDAFSSRLSDVLPIIVEQLKGKDKSNNVSSNPVNHKPQMGISNEKIKEKLSENCEEDFIPEDYDKTSESGIDLECEDERSRDHQLFQMLQLVLKIMMSCLEVLSSSKWGTYVNEIAVHCQLLLAYPHEWVRLASSQVLGSIFGSVEASKVALALKKEDKIKKEKLKKKANSLENNNCLPFLFTGVKRRLKSLILDLTGQLECNGIGPQLADQVVKNLAFLARVLKFLEDRKEVREDAKEDESKLSLAWMMFKMRKIVNKEVPSIFY
ncbi:hypothetical protein J437_LFUL012311 [Ladona fulva]|uniref:U3 small nucleolar RNA-associated protein 20 domain-containing protein n=1 Tax=Ladona fulva TaxID=123851 RepID=A0A8K0P3J9_LADFU|nr:hypothetical protein J437_LFUL012311 [Ladona fulva]